MTDERKALEYVAQQYSIIDHLVAKVYGPGVRFESLSAFGQNTIESLARESGMLDPQSERKQSGSQMNQLRKQVEGLEERLAEALKENQSLWEENEDMRMELYTDGEVSQETSDN